MATIPVTTRLAIPEDTIALASIVVTSFRQDDTVFKLHYPLSQNISFASDTLYYWSRRFHLFMLDPTVHLVVAEVPTEWARERDLTRSRDGLEHWQSCLDWLETQNVTQDNALSGKRVIGFAVWKELRNPDDSPSVQQTWYQSIRSSMIQRQMQFSKWAYPRNDIDLEAYRCYYRAEEELKEKFHQNPCYYLDLMSGDFRYGHCGVGRALVQTGLELSPNKAWPAITEASKMGFGLYKQCGFQQKGTWVIKFDDGTVDISLPYMVRPGIRDVT